VTQPPPEPPAPDEPTGDPTTPLPPPAWQQPPPGYQPPGYQPPGYQPPGYQQPGYGQPGYGQPAPYGMVPYDPQAKSKIAAGLLGIFLGGFGVHRFYLGFTKIGIIQIVVTIFTCGIGSLWGFVEGILYLVGSNGYTTDATGRPLRD
jgi:TM2 domain-containing membrane protein YozV